jgi:hypothetical protein
MTLFELATGLRWTPEKEIYIQPNESEHALLIEYLNTVCCQHIEEELDTLTKFQSILALNNPIATDEFIMSALYGYDDYDGELYVFVGGATDFTVSLLFNPQNNKFFIMPVYERETKYFTTLPILISLLEEVRSLSKILLPQKE